MQSNAAKNKKLMKEGVTFKEAVWNYAIALGVAAAAIGLLGFAIELTHWILEAIK